MSRLVPALLIAIALSTAAPILAQQADPAFEVASVRLNASGPGPRSIRALPGGRFTMTNMPLAEIVRFAWNLEGTNFRVVGLPAWSTTTNFDITASLPARLVHADGTFTMDEGRVMTRRLLADRFGLVSHMETRTLPIYVLTKARSDGRLGPRLHPSGVVCPPITVPAGLPPPPPPPPPPGSTSPPISIDCVGFSIGGHMYVRKSPMDRFAAALAIFVQRSVVNDTALDGLFDLDLDYAPDPAIAQQNSGPRTLGGPPPPGPDANAAELFTALEEQLGLKLESTRGPVDLLVVDRIDRPVED